MNYEEVHGIKTVKDLIAALQQLDQNMPVWAKSDEPTPGGVYLIQSENELLIMPQEDP